MLKYFAFFPINRILHVMQIVSTGDNLHEMLNPVYGENQKKYLKMLSTENFTQSAQCYNDVV